MADISDCVIIIDKPPGLASHEVTTLVKKIAGATRSGHAGTLDPEVSGVLPVALGKATKLLRYIAGKEKTYVGIMKFKRIMKEDEIKGIFSKFTGELVQTPPKISAVRKVPRKRTVYSLKLLEADGHLALFETRVDAGTYIRTLCEDMGKTCGGARMVELRRTAVGKINEEGSHTMQELVDAVWFHKKGRTDLLEGMLVDPETFIDLPRVHLKETSLQSIFSGAQVMAPAIESIDPAVRSGDRVSMYCGKRFIGVGVSQMDALDMSKDKKGLAVKLERVHKDGR